MSRTQELLAAGDPKAALAALQQQVRERPSDAKLRIFLFQLLCVLGQWPRALNQLTVCAELDASTLPMVNTYREALQCELVREAVFAGKTTPIVLGRPQAWIALLVEALQADARGDTAGAARLRDEAFEQAPTSSGRLNDAPFEWIADADSRLGPVLEVVVNGRYGWVPFAALRQLKIEAPADLRDLAWAPAQLGFVNGGETVALIPTRYVGSAESDDGALQMARRSDWLSIGPEHYRGLGQRVLAIDAGDTGLLEVRELVFDETEASDGDASTSTEGVDASAAQEAAIHDAHSGHAAP